MSKLLAKLVRTEKRKHQPERKLLSKEERLALHKLRHEAHKKGAVLKDYGRGGLSPSLVLTVFRRDEFKCKKHGDRGEGEHGGLTVHHIGGVVESEWLSKKGHKNQPSNLVVVCEKGHDEIHEKARDDGTDSSQVLAEADAGTRHDKGQPRFEE